MQIKEVTPMKNATPSDMFWKKEIPVMFVLPY